MNIKLFLLSTVWVLSGVFTSGCIVIDLNGCSMQSVKGSKLTEQGRGFRSLVAGL